jgi:glutamate---cysteine ligase / carboxylate-amine ligase
MAASRIPFASSPRPTLGVEIELQIIDPETWNLTSSSLAILDALEDRSKIK